MTGTHFQRRVVEVVSKDVRCGLIASCCGIWESTSCVCVCVFRKSSIDSVLECSCAKMSFVQEAVEQLHAVRFSSLQAASDCGTDGSLARFSLVLAKAGLRDLERSPRRLLGPGMDAETMIKHGPCFMGVGMA